MLCPTRAQALPSAPPTSPAPRIAMRMMPSWWDGGLASALQRHAREAATGADRLQGLHTADRGRTGQALRQEVLVRGVARYQLEQEVAASADHVAFAHFGPGGDQLLEGRQDRLLLAVQPDDGEERNLPAELLWIWIGVVPANDPGLLQPSHATQARRRRDAGPARQLHVGDAAVVLQLGQDLAVDRVQDRGRRFGVGCFHARCATFPGGMLGTARVAQYYCSGRTPQGINVVVRPLHIH